MATHAEIYQKVKDVLVEQLGVDEDKITEDASFQEDLDADSLDLVELIMELEDQFKIKIPDEDAQKITTVGQAVDYMLVHQPGGSSEEADEGGSAPVPVGPSGGPSGSADDADPDETVAASPL